MNYTLEDIDITKLVMQIRKMRAAIAAIINDDKEKVINAKKIFYDRTLLNENNEKQEIENDFYFYLQDQKVDKEFIDDAIQRRIRRQTTIGKNVEPEVISNDGTDFKAQGSSRATMKMMKPGKVDQP